MGKQRPIGFNDKPIPHGMLYSDYTTEQIEAACNAPDFEEKCKHAQDNAERMMELMKIKDEKRSGAEGFRMKNERLIELALGSEAATAEESVAMAMRLLNWHQTEKGGPMLEDFNIFSAKSMKEFHESKTMNHASTEIVATITEAIVFPNIGLTLTQEEADAIKKYVRVRYFEDNIQGAVHSGFVRHGNDVN